MTLTEFLLARIAEDETQAHWLAEDRASSPLRNATQGGRFGVRRRMLAECEAKRALIAAVRGDPFDAMGAESAYEDLVLQHLALPYADHPDYDPAWAPESPPVL